jgi:hypothetical protein
MHMSESVRSKAEQLLSVMRIYLASPRMNTNRKKPTILVFHNVMLLLIKPVLHLLDEL